MMRFRTRHTSGGFIYLFFLAMFYLVVGIYYVAIKLLIIAFKVARKHYRLAKKERTKRLDRTWAAQQIILTRHQAQHTR